MAEKTDTFVIQVTATLQKMENLKKDLIKQGFTETTPGMFEMLDEPARKGYPDNGR